MKGVSYKTKKYGQSWACWWRLKLVHSHSADSWLGIQLCYFRPWIEIHAERQTLEHSRNVKWQHGFGLFGFVRNLGRIYLILSESISKSSICVNSWLMNGQWPEHTHTHTHTHTHARTHARTHAHMHARTQPPMPAVLGRGTPSPPLLPPSLLPWLQFKFSKIYNRFLWVASNSSGFGWRENM